MTESQGVETTTETKPTPEKKRRTRTAPKKFIVVDKLTSNIAINVGVDRAAELLAAGPDQTVLVFDFDPKKEIHTLKPELSVNEKFKIKNVVSYEA